MKNNSNGVLIGVITFFLVVIAVYGATIYIREQNNTPSTTTDIEEKQNLEIDEEEINFEELKQIDERDRIKTVGLLNLNSESIKADFDDILEIKMNTIYLVEYNNKDAILTSTSNINGERVTINYFDDEGLISSDYSVQDLTGVTLKKKLFEKENIEDLSAYGFSFNDDQSMLYISTYHRLPKEKDYFNQDWNELIEFNFEKETYKIIYSASTNKEKFEDYAGAVVIENLIENKYLVTRIQYCNACDEVPPGGVLVTNLYTGEEVFLGDVSGIEIKSETIVGKLNVYVPKENCDDMPICYGTYEAIGELVEKKLP